MVGTIAHYLEVIIGTVILMLMEIGLENSNYSEVRELSERFIKVCKNLCNENKKILEDLKNLEPKNES